MNVLKAKYKNKVEINVYYHPRRVKGCVDADRIQLIIKSEKETRGWLMTSMEAQDVIAGLARACSMALENEIPAFYDSKLAQKPNSKDK